MTNLETWRRDEGMGAGKRGETSLPYLQGLVMERSEERYAVFLRSVKSTVGEEVEKDGSIFRDLKPISLSSNFLLMVESSKRLG